MIDLYLFDLKYDVFCYFYGKFLNNGLGAFFVKVGVKQTNFSHTFYTLICIAMVNNAQQNLLILSINFYYLIMNKLIV
jgi:hypothetical protein